MLSPKRYWRSGQLALVTFTSVKPFRFLIVPSVFNCRFDTLLPGLLNFGVLVKLNDSARNCSVNFSVIRNWRKRPKSQPLMPGPRKRFQPAVPKPNWVVPNLTLGSANANGSK